MKNLIQKHTAIAFANHVGNVDNANTGKFHADVTANACCLFGPWLNEHYVLVTSKKMNHSAYVNKAHDILIHGSDLHYTNLIIQHGKSVSDLFQEFLKTNPNL